MTAAAVDGAGAGALTGSGGGTANEAGALTGVVAECRR